MVDIVGEDLEVEEQEGTNEEGEPEGTNEDMDASRKRKTTLDVWEHFTMKKVEGNLKSNAIIVASFTWMSLAKVHPICVII